MGQGGGFGGPALPSRADVQKNRSVPAPRIEERFSDKLAYIQPIQRDFSNIEINLRACIRRGRRKGAQAWQRGNQLWTNPYQSLILFF
jgi:hypothetical protein